MVTAENNNPAIPEGPEGHDMRGQQRASLLWPTLFALLTLGVLVGLGTWQLERRAWKEDLIARIEDRATSEPIIVDAAATLFGAGEDLEYTPVRARGQFLHDREVFYYASGQRGPGYHVYTPLVMPSGQTLIVNRGFIPESEKAAKRGASERAVAGATDLSEVVGLLRKPGVMGLFTPGNDVGRNIWYWRDLPGMAEYTLGANPKAVLPFFIEAVATAEKPPAGAPRGGVTRLELPNRHLEYALTWYGLAIALIGVYLAFVRSRWQLTRERPILGNGRRRNWGKT